MNTANPKISSPGPTNPNQNPPSSKEFPEELSPQSPPEISPEIFTPNNPMIPNDPIVPGRPSQYPPNVESKR